MDSISCDGYLGKAYSGQRHSELLRESDYALVFESYKVPYLVLLTFFLVGCG